MKNVLRVRTRSSSVTKTDGFREMKGQTCWTPKSSLRKLRISHPLFFTQYKDYIEKNNKLI